MGENTYAFDLPTHHKSIIKVVGVGGGGSNAVNHMYNMGIKDVEFVVCNTDSQALQSSPVPNKLQIGANLTSGLGAGANPEKGRNAAIESKEEIKELLGDGTKMVFITAGMGGGTGTGGAPIIAQVARQLDILTVGIATIPFGFEGRKKMAQAQEGISLLKDYCDTVIVISNDKIKEIFGNLTISEAFAQADNVLTTAAKGIAEIITVPGYVNVDFEDVKTVMYNAGAAVMGSAETYGEGRARRAAEMAINSPLLNNENIRGAQKILLSIVSGVNAELQMDELTEITDYMQEFAGDEAEVIFGHGIDSNLGENIRVTVIATGFQSPDDIRVRIKEEDEEVSEVGNNFVPEPIRKSKPESGDRYFDLESSEGFDQFSLFNEPTKKQREIELEITNRFEDKEEKKQNEFNFEFDFDKKRPSREQEEDDEDTDDLNFDFEGTFDVVEEEEEDSFDFTDEEEGPDVELEELEGMAHPFSKKMQLIQARKEREETIDRNRSLRSMNSESFKEKWDVPAYERKKVTLERVPHSSQANISKYNLTDDNQILGNNRYLHDNVD